MGGTRGYDIFPRTPLARAGVALAFLACAALGALAIWGLATVEDSNRPCEGRIGLRIENETDGELVVLGDREVLGTVGGGDGRTVHVCGWYNQMLIRVVDETGRTRFVQQVSLDDLERMEHRITIGAP